MAYDEALAERIRSMLAARSGLTERKVFGGIAWMLGGNMACGVLGDGLLVRLSHEDADRALEAPQVGPFRMGSRPPSKGFVVVEGGAVTDDAALARWVEAGAAHAQSLPPK